LSSGDIEQGIKVAHTISDKNLKTSFLNQIEKIK
jgi:hypothetical protein